MAFQYVVEREKDGKFILVRYVGQIESSLVTPVVAEAGDLAKKLGIRRFLVDLTEAQRIKSPFADFDMADNLEKAGISRTDRIALLVNPGDNSHDFYETVLFNGGYNVRLFRERSLAERHLNG